MLQTLAVLMSLLLCQSPAIAQTETGQSQSDTNSDATSDTKSDSMSDSMPDNEQRLIREVRVIVMSIYTDEEAAESSFKSFTDRNHISTRDSVVRNQILFKKGDVLDAQLLEASERKLRAFKFLNEAAITVVPVDAKTVDVEVVVKDAWSLEPGANIEGGGGLATITAHLIEFNLLGYGKKAYVDATYENDVGTTWKLGYSDYQLLNSRWVGTATYSNGPLVEAYYAQAQLPLFSPDAKWSYGGLVTQADRIVRLFEDGDEVSRFNKDRVQLNAFAKRSFGPRFEKTIVTLRLDYLKEDFSDLGSETTSPLPPDQENLTPTIGVSTGKSRFVKNTFINKMGNVEDQWLGHKYGGRLGYGIPLGDGFELWDTRAFVFKNMAFAHGQLLNLDTMVTSEVERNTFVNAKARYYKKFSRHTVATNFKMNLGFELDSSRQFQLGADSGLRGYPARAFTGDRLGLINLEDRQFWGEFSLGPKFALGTVVFIDGGNVWKRDESLDLSDLNWSAGFGFRIGMSNLPGRPIVRIDFGWAIGVDEFTVTLGPEQQF
jgi:hypothetical protein